MIRTVSKLLDLYDKWIQAINLENLRKGELVNEEEFFASLNQIFKYYEESNLIPAKSVNTLIDYVRKHINPVAFVFTGRPYCKGLGVFVKQASAKAALKDIIDNYFRKEETSLMMFDEIERQVVKSTLSAGACLINLDQEVWFF